MVLSPDGQGQIADAAAVHRDPALAPRVAEYVAAVRRTALRGPLHELLLGDRPARRITGYGSRAVQAERRRWTGDEGVLALSDALGVDSLLVVPLPGRRRQGDDVMVLVRAPGSLEHTDDDLRIAVDLGRRAGLLLDNARLYEQQHLIATALQRSLLPDLPEVPGLTVAARYHAGQAGSDVGGDFYELIDVPGDGTALAIGDVAGHDVYAAAAMGHLKGLLRACAWDRTLDTPAAVLHRVDELTAALGMTTMATVTYAQLTRDGSGTWSLEHSTAGHPPLLVRHPDGAVEFLPGTGGIPLGVDPVLPGSPSRTGCPPGPSSWATPTASSNAAARCSPRAWTGSRAPPLPPRTTCTPCATRCWPSWATATTTSRCWPSSSAREPAPGRAGARSGRRFHHHVFPDPRRRARPGHGRHGQPACAQVPR